MTLLAGAISRRGVLQRSDEWFGAMTLAISRSADERIESRRDASGFLLKLDIGAFGHPARYEAGSATTYVSGEPIFAGESARNRATDTRLVHDLLAARQHSELARARGVWSAAHYDRMSRRLVLVTDRLGVRPLYWWTDGDVVAFSSTLRLLEQCPLVPKQMDLRGLAERVAIGYPLGVRTPYAEISLLRAGEVVESSAQGVEARQYWRWQDVPRSDRDIATLTRDAYDAFDAGVRLRLGADRTTTAFLSGGLDSRCVVASLRTCGADVHTFNFSRPATQDREFGAALARSAGTEHEEHTVPDPDDPRWSQMIADSRAASTAAIKSRIEHPQLVWSGDGGSVGLGHVYMRPASVERCLADDVPGVADAYLAAERATLPLRLLQPAIATGMSGALKTGVVEELERLTSYELSQSYWLFLMENDQRRHLFQHFEDIDRHRTELQLPFFDFDFLALIASVPIEARLYHAFYVAWLDEFPAYVSRTRWQAYPGHVPCPIPVDGESSAQWDLAARARSLGKRRRSVRSVGRMLLSPDFAGSLMKRHSLALAAAMHRVGVRDYGYLIHAAEMIQRHWTIARASEQRPPARHD